MGSACCQEQTFREASTEGAETFGLKDQKLLKRLSEVEAFECELPFYRMRIDKYEGCIKRFVSRDDNCAVTIDQLRYAFAEDEPWKAIDDDSSMLYRLFNDPELKDDD